MNLNTLKKLNVWLIMYSLTLNSYVYGQQPQVAQNNGTFQPRVDVSTADKVNQTIQNVTGMATNVIQQGMMQSWQVEKDALNYINGLKNSPVAIQSTNSKLFPNCPLPQTRVDRPQDIGLCQLDITDQATNQQTIQMEKHARSIWNIYSNSLKTSHSVSAAPSGLTCIDRSIEQLLNELLAKKNEFSTIRNRLEATIAEYTKSLNARTKKMEDMQFELEGGNFGNANGKPPIYNHSTVYNKFPDCKEALDAAAIDTGDINSGKQGLLGLKRSLDSKLTPALNIIEGANNNSIQYAAKNQAAEIIRKMKETDVETAVKNLEQNSYSENNDRADIKFSSFKNVVKDKFDSFQSKVKRLNTKLKKNNVAFELPPMDADFQKNLDANNFENSLKNGYYAECIKQQTTYSGKSGPENIWDKINIGSTSEFIRTKNNGTSNIDVFKTEFKKIMDRIDLTWEQKINQIKSLEGNLEYKLTLNEAYTSNPQDLKSAVKAWRPSELLGAIYKNCNDKYNKTPLPNASNRTTQDIVNEYKKDIQEIKNEEKTFYTNLENSLVERVLNCSGVTYDSTPNQCTKEKLDPNKSSFCLPQSLQCANKVNSCFNQIDSRQKEVSNNLENEVKAYNAAYDELEKRINQEISLMGEAMKFQQNMIMTRFPGSIPIDSALTNDLFVDFGSPKSNERHLDLIQEGKTDSVAETVKNKISKIDQVMKSTYDGLKAYLEKERNKIEANLKSEQDFWDKVKTDCGQKQKQYITKMNSDSAKAQADQAKITAQKQQDFNDYCKNIIAFNRRPGCEAITSVESAVFKLDAMYLQNETTTSNFKEEYLRNCNDKSAGQRSTSKIDGKSFIQNKDYKLESFVNCNDKDNPDALFAGMEKNISPLLKRVSANFNIQYPELLQLIKQGKLREKLKEKFASEDEIEKYNVKKIDRIKELIEGDAKDYCNKLKKPNKEAEEQSKSRVAKLDETNKVFSEFFNSLQYLSTYQNQVTHMGETGNLSSPSCSALLGQAPRNSPVNKPMTFTDNVDAMMRGSRGQ